jgi:hypothetical protein
MPKLEQLTPYNEPNQSRDHMPDAYENLLGDALEAAFAQGIHDIEGVVGVLKNRGVPGPSAQTWSTELLRHELARLGN